jgi:type I restriction enzyme S subunit
MKDWNNRLLGDIARVTAGDPAPQAWEDFATNGRPFVRMQDVGRYGQTDNLTEVRDKLSAAASQRLKIFPAGSVLVPKSGASIRLNHRAILGMEAHVVSHLAVIVPGPSLSSRFLYYWLCGKSLGAITHDSDMPSMKTSELAKLAVPLPPLAEQERLVKILDETDALRKLRSEADSRTAELIPTLFHEIFGTINKTEALGSVASVNSGVAKGRQFNGKTPVKVPYLRVANVQDGRLDLTKLKEIDALPNEIEKLSLRTGDVVMTEGGDFNKLGRGAMLDRDLPGCIYQNHVFRVRCDRSRLLPEYFASFLLSASARSYFMRCAKKTSNLASINMTQLRALPVPSAPLALQQKFAQRLREIRKMEAAQARSRVGLDALFASLLDKAFKGQL